MNKTTIKSFAEDIGHVAIDADTLDTYFDDILEDVAKRNDCPLITAELFAISDGTAEYTIPSNGVLIRALFHHSRMLSYASISDLEAYDDEWRTLSDDPYFYTLTEKTSRTFQLVPEPDADSDALIPLHGEPLGEDFPDNYGTIIYTSRRETELPEWIGIFLAFKILEREFARPSDHQDRVFADACGEVAEMLWLTGGLA